MQISQSFVFIGYVVHTGVGGGVQGFKRTPKTFDLVKSRAKSLRIREIIVEI